MNRSLCITILTLLVLAIAPFVAVAQNSGVVPLKSSALDYLFQPPIPWSGGKFSKPKPSFDDRFYVVAGGGVFKTWEYSSGDLSSSSMGQFGSLSVGYQVSPVHSIELNGGWSRNSASDNYFSAGASYLFNITSFASRLERPRKWEVLYRVGGEALFGESLVVAASNGLRLKYNISPTVGLYVEPNVSVIGYASNIATSYRVGNFNSGISFGVTIVPSRIVDNINSSVDRRREYWGGVDYEISPLFAIKTNLMYDAATILNVELEVPIGRRISLAGEWTFPWWSDDDGTKSSERSRTQLLNATVEAKYWLGERDNRAVMTGWFAGVYGGAGLYDFERDANGYQGDFTLSTGVSGGFAHALNRRGNLRVEYSLSLGCLYSDYSYYEATYGDDDLWHPITLERGTLKWFGPTRARVSFAWLVTHKRLRRR